MSNMRNFNSNYNMNARLNNKYLNDGNCDRLAVSYQEDRKGNEPQLYKTLKYHADTISQIVFNPNK